MGCKIHFRPVFSTWDGRIRAHRLAPTNRCPRSKQGNTLPLRTFVSQTIKLTRDSMHRKILGYGCDPSIASGASGLHITRTDTTSLTEGLLTRSFALKTRRSQVTCRFPGCLAAEFSALESSSKTSADRPRMTMIWTASLYSDAPLRAPDRRWLVSGTMQATSLKAICGFKGSLLTHGIIREI